MGGVGGRCNGGLGREGGRGYKGCVSVCVNSVC